MSPRAVPFPEVGKAGEEAGFIQTKMEIPAKHVSRICEAEIQGQVSGLGTYLWEGSPLEII